MNSDELACLPDGSICEDCIYCIARVIEPLDNEAFEIYIQEDPDSNIFVHVCCIILDIDLHDHVVRECNKYDDGSNENPFLNNKFLKG